MATTEARPHRKKHHHYRRHLRHGGPGRRGSRHRQNRLAREPPDRGRRRLRPVPDHRARGRHLRPRRWPDPRLRARRASSHRAGRRRHHVSAPRHPSGCCHQGLRRSLALHRHEAAEAGEEGRGVAGANGYRSAAHRAGYRRRIARLRCRAGIRQLSRLPLPRHSSSVPIGKTRLQSLADRPRTRGLLFFARQHRRAVAHLASAHHAGMTKPKRKGAPARALHKREA